MRRESPRKPHTLLGEADKGGLLSADRNGRHRYFRLAFAKVAEMIEGIVAVALEKRRFRRYPLKHTRLVWPEFATTPCGPLSVDLTDSLVAANASCSTTSRRITTAGTRFFTEFGIALPARRSTPRHFCRLCLDWTERRPHIAGALRAAITKRFFISAGWKG